jgi:PD-(D/E)XK nuclease superfamily
VMDEKYFHTLFYLIIKLAGFQIGAEIHTQRGRTDAALLLKEKIIIFEFKFNASAKKAIKQIKEKKYYQFFQEKNLPILLVGVNFNGSQRTIDDWQMEVLSVSSH